MFLLACAMVAMNLYAQLPAVLIYNPVRLATIKKNIQQKDQNSVTMLSALLQQADSMLAMKPVSVMDKAFTPESGNKHDYMSQAPYFW